jgi:excisionase family DNA binding protein
MSDRNHQNDQDTREFWTVKQVAERHLTSEKKVRREIDSGHLVAHRFGGQIRIRTADLVAYERVRRMS